MKAIQKVALKEDEDVRWQGINCAVLDTPFFKIVWDGGEKFTPEQDDDKADLL